MRSTKVNSSSPTFLSDLMSRQDVLKIIVLALSETITGYTKVPVTPKSPFLKENGTRAEIGVAGIIRFEGPDFSVEILLGLSKGLFLNLYENMFQSDAGEISEENQDLAAEILNIAFGIMDPKFKELGLNLRSSFPKIYTGDKLEKALSKIESRAIVVPFEAQNKAFYVEIYSANSLMEDWQYDPPGSKVA